MSSRARASLIAHGASVTRFEWADNVAWPQPAGIVDSLSMFQLPEAMPEPLEPEIDIPAIEREAFTKGYAQGERAGAEAAATRGEAMLRRLAQTIEELGALRTDMIRKSERQLVQLAIAIAQRVIQREITLDRELLMAMARVALDRLGEVSTATIRLHPEDYAATTAARGGALSTESVRVVSDAGVSRGGCLVESDYGLIDLSISAQVGEIATALLGADHLAAEEESVRVAN